MYPIPLSFRSTPIRKRNDPIVFPINTHTKTKRPHCLSDQHPYENETTRVRPAILRFFLKAPERSGGSTSKKWSQPIGVASFDIRILVVAARRASILDSNTRPLVYQSRHFKTGKLTHRRLRIGMNSYDVGKRDLKAASQRPSLRQPSTSNTALSPSMVISTIILLSADCALVQRLTSLPKGEDKATSARPGPDCG